MTVSFGSILEAYKEANVLLGTVLQRRLCIGLFLYR